MDFDFHPYVPKPKTKSEKALIRRERLQRDFNDWIHGGNLYEKKKESSITLGVVPGVVVEERRLSQMLKELARQRNDYKCQYNYDKKVFWEKQMNKSEELRKALVHESLTRGWSVADRDVSIDDSSEGVSIVHGYVPKYSEKSILSKTRVALLDYKAKNKREATDSSGNGIEWLTLPNIEDKPSSRGTFIKTVKFDAQVTDSSPRHSARSVLPQSRDTTFDRYPSIYRERSKSLPTPSLIPWGKIKSTNIQPGKCLPPVSKDTRFEKLESLLEEPYNGSKRLKTVKVPDIVSNCDSLFVPAKHENESKLEVEKRIRQFLIQSGLIRS